MRNCSSTSALRNNSSLRRWATLFGRCKPLFSARLLAIILAVQIVSGHWVVLQTIAWVNMFVEQAQKGIPTTEALEWVIGGDHPCKLCLAVTEGQSDEQKEPLLNAEMKWEAVLPVFVVLLPPTPENYEYPEWEKVFQLHISDVPHGPPRLA